MNIAFIHYHLKPGGVTRVIQQQISICERMNWHYCILAGENPLNMSNVIVIPELNYDQQGQHEQRSQQGQHDPEQRSQHDPRDPRDQHHNPEPADTAAPLRTAQGVEAEEQDRRGIPLADAIETATCAFFQKGSLCADIVHVHNATLAKNSDLLPALHILQERGKRLFLQLHDFAEDGRPDVYSPIEYLARAHYACINSRDRDFLAEAGLPEKQLHYLPNLVTPFPGAVSPTSPASSGSSSPSASAPSPAPSSSSLSTTPSALSKPPRGNNARRYALYPVRGIRRKNLGELILLSLLFDDITFGVTLKPNNEKEMPSYQRWETLAQELHAPVEFNAAEKESFESLLARSDFFISTSVQEGFGFTFLEPWTLQKSVTGRIIPYVHKDFVRAGMKMDSFYTDIPIPIGNIDVSSFRQNWLQESQRRFEHFLVALRKQGLDSAIESTQRMISSLNRHFAQLYGSRPDIDFARLDVANQVSIIRQVQTNPQLAESIRKSVPQFSSCPLSSCTFDDLQTIEHNYYQVFSAYSAEQYGQRMKDIYESIMGEAISPSTIEGLNKESLLQSFLDPANIFLITSS